MEFGGDKSAGGADDKFERFILGEIRRHLLLYSIQGLSPSPQLHMKMKDQTEEPFQGCDAIANITGNTIKSNSSKRITSKLED